MVAKRMSPEEIKTYELGEQGDPSSPGSWSGHLGRYGPRGKGGMLPVSDKRLTAYGYYQRPHYFSRSTGRVLDQVVGSGEPFIVSREGKPLAVLLKLDLNAIEGFAVLNTPGSREAIKEAEEALSRGETVGRQGMMGGAKAHYDGIVAFSQTDFTEDLKKITVPVLVMHGDDDQIVPYADSAPLSAKLLKNGTLKTYKGFPHGMPTTEADTINADLLTFLRA